MSTVRRLLVSAALALTAILASAAPAGAANVALYNDTGYVGNQESGNMGSVLLSQGHTVFTFTDESAGGFQTALTGRDVLVIPDLANGDLAAALTPSAREAIRAFVEGGGGFVISGHAPGNTDRAAKLINTVFNFELTESLVTAASAKQTGSAGTEFAGGPEALPNNADTSALDVGTLPTDARVVYLQPSISGASVAVLYRGLGSITYLGWDWFNSNPPNPAGLDGGWNAILNSAVARPTVSISNVGVAEGDSGVTPARFVVSLAGGPVSEEVRVTLEASGGDATAGQDYVAPPPTVTIPRGETQASVDVPVLGDAVDERNETFELKITAATGATIGAATGTGTIADDDPTPGRCKNRQDANDAGGTLNGSAFGDLLVGKGGKDVLNGAGGDDCLRGRAGNDRLSGGDGDDSLSGEDGSDRLSGGEGKDTLSGGARNDVLSGGNGNDRLGGGAGNDKINGGQGLNSYSGGSGDDNIIAANGRRETIDCGSGRHDKVRADRQDSVRNCETVARL
jgi:Ca2+-binding RTX toxin-like protein